MQSVLPSLFFYALATMILVSAVVTITRRNAVHAVIWLISTLLGIAGLFLHQHAEFLAAVQVIVYIGGITVLFLFVIMLVNLDEAAKKKQFSGQWKIVVICAGALLAELGYFIFKGAEGFYFAEPAGGSLQPNTQLIALALYRDYLLPFELASLLLLVAMIGAVVLAKKDLK
ncbi:MAG: NADH-quinone oxidoreductase subunit J [Acidobacteria bacterium]|nr:NADH-quinone oxidoreductase subunit J [Acidobacteriota bacterium]